MARLKLLKANHQSQQFRLEDDVLKRFPQEIERSKGFIRGFEADMKTLAAHPHPEDGFAGLTVRGDTLTDKDNAGAAILAACKDFISSEPVEVGSYRGFTMLLSVEDFGKQYVMTLKGSMTHRVNLGGDARGNLIRMDNALAGMEQRLQSAKTSLENLYQQMNEAKAELGKPFSQEEELRVKSARLDMLNIQLNIDTGAGARSEQAIAKSERPSVLERLKQPLPERMQKAEDRDKRHQQER